jgi:hypothetical protein
MKKYQILAQLVEQFAAWHPIIKKFAKEYLRKVEKLKDLREEKHCKRPFNNMKMKKLPGYLPPKSIYACFYISGMVPNTYIE